MNSMNIIKLEIIVPEAVKAIKGFKDNRLKALKNLRADVQSSFSESMNELLNLEMSFFLGSSDQTDNKRNGFKEREYTFKGIGTVRIKVPQDRKSRFESSIIKKNERVDPQIKEDLAILHLAGISNRSLGMISRRILGVEFSKDTVSKSLEMAKAPALKWLDRPLKENYWALYIDGTNFKIQRRGTTEKELSLVVLGIGEDCHKSLLAIEPGYKRNEYCWRSVFSGLKNRGLDSLKVQIGIMDGLPGLE